MRFALLGDHADGLAMARALVASGRHELGQYAGPGAGVEYLRRWELTPPRLADLEDALADPSIAAVLVAVTPGNRANVLRRAVQSERHVLCVHPPDHRADTAHEAAMIRAETGYLLFPLLPETLHPAVRRLVELLRGTAAASPPEALVRNHTGTVTTAVTTKPTRLSEKVGLRRPPGLIEMQRLTTEHVLLDADTPGHKPGLPGWDLLRFLGGEIVEVTALGRGPELDADEPLLLSGRFADGGLFQATFLPRQAQERWLLKVVTELGPLQLEFAEGWPGPARLWYVDATGGERVESFPSWNPWAAMVQAFEAALGRHDPVRAPAAAVHSLNTQITRQPPTPAAPRAPSSADATIPTWQDAIRCLELDDAARRSIERRRTSTLEYQEATEEASFKGTMTLVGCALLWISLMLLILSVWVPWLGWFIAPAFGLFMVVQVLRWAVPPKPRQPQEK